MQQPGRGRLVGGAGRRTIVRLVLWLALGLAGALAPGLASAAPAHAAVLRGICDPGILRSWWQDGPAVVDEFADRLGAQVVRINLDWDRAEPSRGAYDEDYLKRVTAAVTAIHDHGMQALVVVCTTPRWASDRALWRTALPGDQTGVYHAYYPPALDSLDELGALMERLSGELQGQVLGYTCWNEPNFWQYLYPQRTGDSPAFGARRYTQMLAAFSAGVRAGDPLARVVAGETAPFGDNTRFRTSPQRFARQVARAGGEALFDAYSHHPYAIAGTARIAPSALPRDPAHTVGLANIDVLLDIFPGKPLYLSEFGYATSPNRLLGTWVSKVRQAHYLKVGYRLAAKHPRIEMMVWFPRQDAAKEDTYSDPLGNYCGLITLEGERKQAYFAYAGGNTLTLEEPGSVRSGGLLVLRGSLSSERLGVLRDKPLTVLARRPGRSWVVVTRTTTGDDGTYRVRLHAYKSATWKVRWPGVVTSTRYWVPVR